MGEGSGGRSRRRRVDETAARIDEVGGNEAATWMSAVMSGSDRKRSDKLSAEELDDKVDRVELRKTRRRDLRSAEDGGCSGE